MEADSVTMIILWGLLAWQVGLAWPLMQIWWWWSWWGGRGQGRSRSGSGPTQRPRCPACEAESPVEATGPAEPPPRIEPQHGRPRSVNTSNHYCPHPACRYYGWVGRGNIRSNGHPNGGRWRQLECLVCGCFFMETRGTIFYRSPWPAETIWQVMKALAEGLDIRATARVFDLDPNTIQRLLQQAAGHLEAVSRYLMHDLHVSQVQVDELWAGLSSTRHGFDRASAVVGVGRV